MLNIGRWQNHVNNLEFISKIVYDAFTVLDVFIWRTTHYSHWERPLEGVDALFGTFDAVHIQNTSWTQRLNKSSLWDDIHYKEPVYTIMNYQLCNIISQALISGE